MRHGGAPAAIGLAGPSQTWVSVSASASMRHMGVPRFSSCGVFDMRFASFDGQSFDVYRLHASRWCGHLMGDTAETPTPGGD